MHTWLAQLLAVAIVLVGAGESQALWGRTDLVYPLRYQVTGTAIFEGTRVSGEVPEKHHVHARKVERDVLSIDSPTTFHWEKLLRDGTPLEGSYQDDDSDQLELHAFTSGHKGLDGAKFPFDRTNGVVRMNAVVLIFTEDLSSLRGRTAYAARREDNDDLKGKSGFRFRGKRI
jgi:hypothetical protein